jgi:hypothetical protein
MFPLLGLKITTSSLIAGRKRTRNPTNNHERIIEINLQTKQTFSLSFTLYELIDETSSWKLL